MSFLNYLENKQDFLTDTDLLDLINLNLLSKEENEKTKDFESNTKYLHLAKVPVYYPNSYDKNILNDVILYKELSYSNAQKYILVDKLSKSIIIYDKPAYEFTSLEYVMFGHKERKNLLDFKKRKLGDFNIYSYEDILKEYIDFVNNKENELIHENYSFLYEQGKNQIENLEKLDLTITNKLKLRYIYDEEIEEESFDYTHNNDSIFHHIQDKYDFFFTKYLRDKNYISELLEDEFYKALSNIDKRKYTNERFYKFEREKELKKELIKSFENDRELNLYRTICKATELAGKTLNVNGTKYENHLSKPYNAEYMGDIEIGRYSDYVKIKDVKTITFGRKVLFDIANY